MSGDGRKPEKEIPFEEALERLEELVADLEGGDLALEESLRNFEEGVGLVRLCSERLRAAELRIVELTESAEGRQERRLDLEVD